MSKLKSYEAIVITSAEWAGSVQAASRAEAKSLAECEFNDGNFKAAYEGLKKLSLDPKNDPVMVGKDLELAINSLLRLGRTEEVDDYREAVIKVHEKNWRLLSAAAHTYTSSVHNSFSIYSHGFPRFQFQTIGHQCPARPGLLCGRG